MFYSYKQCEASLPCFFQRSPIAHINIAGARGPMCSSVMSIYLGDVMSKDVLKSFRNLLQGGNGTSAKKLDEDLDILWA